MVLQEKAYSVSGCDLFSKQRSLHEYFQLDVKLLNTWDPSKAGEHPVLHVWALGCGILVALGLFFPVVWRLFQNR